MSLRRRLLVVSDIHGHGKLLERLLDKAAYDPAADRLYLLGDYVNKGPDSNGTLELVASLCEKGAVALMGNNEHKWIVGNTWFPDSKWRPFLAGLPLWAETDGYIFVHAGIRPGVPLHKQSLEDLTGIREDFLSAPIDIGKTVVFGHTPTFRLGANPGELWFGEGKIGIDTGAGHGGYLTLVSITEETAYRINLSSPSADEAVSMPIRRRIRNFR